MHLRRQVTGAGAVLAAAAVVVLGGGPAQAAGSTTGGTTGSAAGTGDWQIGMQLGSAPIELTGTGGPLAALLYVAPISQIAVQSSTGQNLLRLDAASFRTDTTGAALPDEFGLVQPVGGVRVADPDRTGTSNVAQRPTVAGPGQIAEQVESAAAPGHEQIPVRAAGPGNALESPLNWVPIQLGAFGPDGAARPWATGIGLVVLAGGTAGLTVAARRRLAAG
jgi:hypothetical protein